jgi:predicted Fe-Mo cluster-binding NifX family protein
MNESIEKRRVVVACEDDSGLDSPVCGHFGGTPHFLVAETEGESVVSSEVVDNPHVHNHGPGKVPNLVRRLRPDAVLVGGIGRGAVQIFEHHGIDLFAGVTGLARDAVAAWARGELQPGATACDGQGHGHGHGHAHGGGCGHGHRHGPGGGRGFGGGAGSGSRRPGP